MGLIRLYLAFSVVFSHGGIRVPGVEGLLAVYAFFIISGFYMGLVLNSKYQENLFGFYAARFLRLWPSYIVVFAVVLLFVSPMGDVYRSDAAAVYTWLSSTTMIFYNTLAWFGFSGGADSLAVVARSESVPTLIDATHMAHMWSVGVELSFYMIAPFIARKPFSIACALVVSFSLHLIIMSDEFPVYALQRYSAVNTVWLFLLGMMAYWGWDKYKEALDHFKLDSFLVSLVGLLVAVLCISASQKYSDSRVFTAGYFVIFAAILIPVFHATRKSRLDKAVGELSYPVYLVHWPILNILIPGHWGSWYWSCVILAVSVVCAIFLYFCVDRNVERYRVKFAHR